VPTGDRSRLDGRPGPARREESTGEPRRLLAVVIEDEADLRELQRELLEEVGFRTRVFASLPRCPDLVGLAPDLVVLDLIFAGRAEGLAWLERLVADHASVEIPVVVCTADVELARREAALLGSIARAVLLKPFDLDEFFTVVEAAAFGTRRSLGPARGGQNSTPLATGPSARKRSWSPRGADFAPGSPVQGSGPCA
jgi:CheY-like chemotaxis protein